MVLRHPRVATFDRYREGASWRVIWLGLLPLAAVEALGVAYALYGPDAAAGYSSLPSGQSCICHRRRSFRWPRLWAVPRSS